MSRETIEGHYWNVREIIRAVLPVDDHAGVRLEGSDEKLILQFNSDGGFIVVKRSMLLSEHCHTRKEFDPTKYEEIVAEYLRHAAEILSPRGTNDEAN